jgi:hypothetical protein
MIELRNDSLHFRFPEVHADATLRIDFQRTLRIPDDGKVYPLPAGLGRFPLRHVDDFAESVPPPWNAHGGVMMPMFQSEALWLSFDSDYPCAIKIAAGKIDAVTGDPYRPGLHRGPQDYVTSSQPWLDGFCVGKGVIRQFVAMPLGAGYSAEEQVSGAAEHGGLQLHVYPLKAEHFEPIDYRSIGRSRMMLRVASPPAAEMGLAPGGMMRQEIYEDRRPLDHYDLQHGSRCFVHLANSLVWRSITGEAPPTRPFTLQDYARAGIPWFEYYADGETAVPGSGVLAGLKSVGTLAKEKGQVREGRF